VSPDSLNARFGNNMFVLHSIHFHLEWRAFSHSGCAEWLMKVAGCICIFVPIPQARLSAIDVHHKNESRWALMGCLLEGG
jgi:hypothetical protein